MFLLNAAAANSQKIRCSNCDSTAGFDCPESRTLNVTGEGWTSNAGISEKVQPRNQGAIDHHKSGDPTQLFVCHGGQLSMNGKNM